MILRRHTRFARRGFNLIELLIALAITATLLAATFTALDVSFKAYEKTTEQASTHVIARLIMNRIISAVRASQDWGPFPVDPKDKEIQSDFLELQLPDSLTLIGFRYDAASETLFFDTYDSNDQPIAPGYPLLGGIKPNQTNCVPDGGSGFICDKMFTLEYEFGRTLYRMCCHMEIEPDDALHLDLEGSSSDRIVLDFCTIPRVQSYDNRPGL